MGYEGPGAPDTLPVAVLYQAAKAPVIDGIAKPMKPGGYSDSGADIAFALRQAGIPVRTPIRNPDPSQALDWVFPDHASGIAAALDAGAEVLWANTVLFQNHPIEHVLRSVAVVGQRPDRQQKFDDKWLTNTLLREHGLPVARALLLSSENNPDELPAGRFTDNFLKTRGFGFPLIVKPVRGRGSQGVVRVHSPVELETAACELLAAVESIDGKSYPLYGRSLIVEEYLPGEELTITVMPPGVYRIGGATRRFPDYWTLPPLRRFHHQNGVAPYSGIVAITRNSEVVSGDAPELHALAESCARAASLVGAAAPIRIDCRASTRGELLLFDLNMKPNLTGPGRPGRDDQDSLTALAARAIGWSYAEFLCNILAQGWGPDGALSASPRLL